MLNFWGSHCVHCVGKRALEDGLEEHYRTAVVTLTIAVKIAEGGASASAGGKKRGTT